MYNEPDDMTHFTFAKKGLEILMVLYVVYAGLLLLGTVYVRHPPSISLPPNTPSRSNARRRFRGYGLPRGPVLRRPVFSWSSHCMCCRLPTCSYTTLVTETMPGKKYRYLFIITVLSLGMAIIGNIVGAFAPEIIEKVEFFLFFGAANMYIWLLAFAYFPSGTTHVRGATCMHPCVCKRSSLKGVYACCPAGGPAGQRED